MQGVGCQRMYGGELFALVGDFFTWVVSPIGRLYFGL